jgi:DNA-binding NarL/FixJ family response regulator
LKSFHYGDRLTALVSDVLSLGGSEGFVADVARPVLIADHDQACQATVARLLVRAGLSTLEAASGQEALAAARAEKPALIILEVSLPDVGGYEVCRNLRDEFGDDVPIIFVSGAKTEALDRAAGLLIGADDYIVKPFDPEELIARVRRLLERTAPNRNSFPRLHHNHDLTAREVEVLRLLAGGVRTADIAVELVIRPKTVANHVQHILGKLGVHTQAQAVARAYELGVIEPPAPSEPRR